ncbi:glutamine cyclotransferase [Rhodanobacter thiooxydans]|uniref:Glutamine cyclotransferase n=1 Tax=Rhodanobacter thiooxydans TaxID=416169 RepID=A0A154QJC3_9GAMM|nr:glutaminyl-peptide cyclotransferase [Rhodanobacter thiooxydans]EIL98637.1 glutamine cyclotransferase [Rhodanobacter thiooxydans LCS2]KZC24268.1 glutamine cyclotransferase [Rhodanobacter thiooxydans]MCW0201346.1 glutaminyl-peptide cyclotransferase [Rhodanobacter thiooxydans]
MPRWSIRLLAFALLACMTAAHAAEIPVYGYRVVHAYPHDTGAYTEGLFYKDGYLYESTGQVGASTVRKVALETGEVVQRHRLPKQYFGEGIVDWKDRLVQLTWQSGTGFVYDLASFTPQRNFRYEGEGWALTRDGTHLYMSDGTPVLRVLDPETLEVVHRIHVTADGEPVRNLNELEWVDGEIYANVWLTDRIARIDPASGQVTGWIDLTGLFDISRLPDPGDDVLNGIAWDAARKRLFVTGKCWPQLFEIELVKRPAR